MEDRIYMKYWCVWQVNIKIKYTYSLLERQIKKPGIKERVGNVIRAYCLPIGIALILSFRNADVSNDLISTKSVPSLEHCSLNT